MFKISEILLATKGRLASGKAGLSVKGVSTDTRSISSGSLFIALKGPNFDGHDFVGKAISKGTIAAIVDKGFVAGKGVGGVSLIEVKDTTLALGDLARFNRAKFNIPVIGVTGSNGKTTTKDMVAWVLSFKNKVLFNEGTKNNHIGLPQTLLKLDAGYDAAVLEMGTNHPGEIAYLSKVAKPNIGIISNIGQSHLEYFGNLNNVFAEKTALLRNLDKPNIAILNADDAFLKKEIIKNTGLKIFTFGLKGKSDFAASNLKVVSGKLYFTVNRKYAFTLNTLGTCNVYNALSAIAVARVLGMRYADIATQLADFKFPANRLNFLEVNNVKFINDSYNSNPLSLRQALNALDDFKVAGRKIFVMGDMLELGRRKEMFHRQAGRQAAGICDVLIAVGELSRFAAGAAKTAGFNCRNLFHCANNLEAREILFSRVGPRPDDVVLVKGSRCMKLEEVIKA